MMKAVYLLGAYDEVIDHGDFVQLRLRDYSPSKVDVLTARRRVAAWMVVHEDQRRGTQLRRPVHDRPDRQGHSRPGTFADLLVAYQTITGVEVEDAYALVGGEAQTEAKVVDYVR